MIKLRSNAVVAHPVHVVLLNVTKDFKKVLVDHGYTLGALLPASSTRKHDDEDDSEEQGPSISPLLH